MKGLKGGPIASEGVMKGAAAYVVIFTVPYRCSFEQQCSFVLEHSIR
jgi:hypothetical protein